MTGEGGGDPASLAGHQRPDADVGHRRPARPQPEVGCAGCPGRTRRTLSDGRAARGRPGIGQRRRHHGDRRPSNHDDRATDAVPRHQESRRSRHAHGGPQWSADFSRSDLGQLPGRPGGDARRRGPPTLKPLPQLRRSRWLSGTRAWLIGLGLVAVLLVGLIARETVFAQPAAVAIRTATADRGTVTSVVSGTGSLLPVGRMNVSFKQSGILTEVDVKVGDKVTTGQVLARIDSSTQQAALAQAQASLASAQANLQATQSPLTPAQVAQLQHQVSNAQQNYNDTVASVNATNQADAATVASDQAKVNSDCGIDPASVACSQARAQLANDQSKQHMDAINGQSRINSAAQQITSSRDNLAVQTQVKPNALASGQAQVAAAQAQVSAAQTSLNPPTLTAPTSAGGLSINGVPGETAGGGTAQSPGSLPGAHAPQPPPNRGTGYGG